MNFDFCLGAVRETYVTYFSVLKGLENFYFTHLIFIFEKKLSECVLFKIALFFFFDDLEIFIIIIFNNLKFCFKLKHNIYKQMVKKERLGFFVVPVKNFITKILKIKCE